MIQIKLCFAPWLLNSYFIETSIIQNEWWDYFTVTHFPLIFGIDPTWLHQNTWFQLIEQINYFRLIWFRFEKISFNTCVLCWKFEEKRRQMPFHLCFSTFIPRYDILLSIYDLIFLSWISFAYAKASKCLENRLTTIIIRWWHIQQKHNKTNIFYFNVRVPNKNSNQFSRIEIKSVFSIWFWNVAALKMDLMKLSRNRCWAWGPEKTTLTEK